ncbi:TRZ/ATZ family hydrolase [uncultured Pseudoteredinibacter sp.]|uniref:TRZ/ATZ family hydrolase n=1 Tax=uncultured Pseudoteredinibacter sp. TaxID=1641701 RepID=UPI00260F571B|nr:TRZ/ATZ family hydrolase [uncultured Pseudoteredinibacter sp.]
MSQPIDTLIQCRWLITMDSKRRVLEHHSIAVKDGKITAIVPNSEAEDLYQANECIKLEQHIALPGLVNTHGHLAMSLLRGYADDYPLHDWLNDHIWPAEGKFVSHEFVADGARLAMAEMIRGGTTAFSDNYFFPEAVAEVCAEVGMRGSLYSPILNFPTAWGSGPEETIAKSCKLIEQYQEHALVNIGFGPHAPYTVSNEAFSEIAKQEAKYQCGIMVHLQETQKEVDDSIEQYGQRPTERLQSLGVMNERTQCVHMTAVSDEDISILQASKSHVVHCPESNLKLASGFCPTEKLRQAGVNVSLGTDGAASNNDLDMLSEMRTASMLAKAVDNNASALNAMDSLAMATIDGAKALNIDSYTGSLEVGKAADITTVELSALNALPMYDPVSYLVYTNCSHQVSDVWVSGERLLAAGLLQTIDEQALRDNAIEWQSKISAD